MQKKSKKLANTSLSMTKSAIRELKTAQNLSEDALSVVAQSTTMTHHKSGDTLWTFGDQSDYFVILYSGLAEVTRLSLDGRETTIGIYGKSDTLGLWAFTRGAPFHGEARIISQEAGALKIYLKPHLKKATPSLQELQLWIKDMLIAHEHVLRDKIDIMTSSSVNTKALELIYQLIRRFGKPSGDLRHIIPIRLSRSQVAKLLGVRVETVIRLFRKWQKAGFITFTKESIIIEDLKQLEKSIFSIAH